MLNKLLYATGSRFMQVKVYVEQVLHRNVSPTEVLSFEVEQEGVRVLVNTTTRGLSLKLKQQALWERAEISQVQATKRGTFYAESWLAEHVKVLTTEQE